MQDGEIAAHRFQLPDTAFCRDDDVLVGATMTYGGEVAFATEQGVVGVLPRDPEAMDPTTVVTTSLNGDDCARAEVTPDDLETVSGVLRVNLVGGLEREVRVDVDPEKLRLYGLSLDDVVNANSLYFQGNRRLEPTLFALSKLPKYRVMDNLVQAAAAVRKAQDDNDRAQRKITADKKAAAVLAPPQRPATLRRSISVVRRSGSSSERVALVFPSSAMNSTSSSTARTR